jgi:FKBP-type peptidyl-prolyl cis-trans isomerase
MATSTGQRVGIWIIAGAMILGTLAGFIAMVLAPNNQAADQAKAEQELQKQIATYCEEQTAAKKDLLPLKGYEAESFDGSKVKDVEKKVLKAGSGEKLTKTSKIMANYFGWQESGKIFDSTNNKNKTTPIEFSLDGVIAGWSEGLSGLRAGSVVELTIPADKGYGEAQDVSCNPTGALKFVVEIKKIVKD